MKPKIKPTLNAADLRLIRELLQAELIPLNKAERKKVRVLEKEVARLTKELAVMTAYDTDAQSVIRDLRARIFALENPLTQ